MHWSQQVSDYQLIYSNLLAKFDIHNVWNSISNIAQNVWNNSNIASLITLCYSHQIISWHCVDQCIPIYKKIYIVLWSRRALCVMVFYMLAIATEITLSVMSFDVRTTLLVQAACPLDNSTDTQAVSVYKHYKLNDIPLSPPGDWELEVKSEPCKMDGQSGDVLYTDSVILLCWCLKYVILQTWSSESRIKEKNQTAWKSIHSPG